MNPSARLLIPSLVFAALEIGGFSPATAQHPARPQYHSAFPVVSPDGRHVLFARDSGGQTLPYVMNADGSNQRLVPGQFMPTSWFPDGKRLFVVIPGESRRAPVRIASVNVDGTDLKEISIGGVSIMGGAQLLGDGKSLPFIVPVRECAGRQSIQLNVIEMNGSQVRRIPMPAVSGRIIPPMAASADGRQLAFTIADTTDPTSYARSTTLYVMNVDGTGLREIATLPNLMEQP